MREAIAFYRAVVPINRDGRFRCVPAGSDSYHHPTGHQVVTIDEATGGRLLVVWHRFGGEQQGLVATLPRAITFLHSPVKPG